MTPLTQMLARWLPTPMRLPALAILYALMLGGILIAGGERNVPIIYEDVRGE